MKVIRNASVLSEVNGDWLNDLISAIKPFGDGEYVRAFLQLGRELSQEGVNSLRGYLRELEDRAEQNNPPTLPGVALATLHAAKGLEWERVYLVGVSEGVLPWSEPIEEERRLFYVGLTRAKRSLTLTYHQTPSRFLAEAGLVSL
jgi:DNA helicase-2/ATP-dependent DNA helicase PcrA